MCRVVSSAISAPPIVDGWTTTTTGTSDDKRWRRSGDEALIDGPCQQTTGGIPQPDMAELCGVGTSVGYSPDSTCYVTSRHITTRHANLFVIRMCFILPKTEIFILVTHFKTLQRFVVTRTIGLVSYSSCDVQIYWIHFYISTLVLTTCAFHLHIH